MPFFNVKKKEITLNKDDNNFTEYLLSQNKKILKDALINGGIESREFYTALSLQKYLSKYRNSNLKYSESIFKKILWLPSSNGLSKKDVSYISSVINSAH